MKINNSKLKIKNSKLTTLRQWLLKLLSEEEVVITKERESINLLVTCPNTDGGLVQVIQSKAQKIDQSGTTGLCSFNHKLIRSIQHSDFAEFLVYNADNSYVSIIHRDLRDIHDLLVFDDLLYVVSTGTNEVVALDVSYNIQKRYKFDGERDAWHLNCLEIINNRVHVSAFCNFKEHYSYKGKTLGSGFVMDIETKEIFIDKLSQPHSPKFDGEHLYICDSEKKSLKKFDTKKNLVNEITFGSYTRAICMDKNNLYVGLSKSRNIDNNSEEAQIVVLDKNSFEILEKLPIPCSEIYTIELFYRQEPFNKEEIINLYTATTVHELQQKLQKEKLENDMLKKLADIAKLDIAYYLEKNQDIKKAGMDPSEHYFLYGKKEGRLPNSYCEYHKINVKDTVSLDESFYFVKKQLEHKNKDTKTKESQTDMECIDAEMVETQETHEADIVPYDENLMERSRTQWQFGDWESLSKLERQSVQHHPERAKLILLAASAHAQLGDDAKAREFTKLSLEWGCSKKLVSQIMISGVYNSLGRSAAINQNSELSKAYFEKTIKVGMPQSEAKLLAEARLTMQCQNNQKHLTEKQAQE